MKTKQLSLFDIKPKKKTFGYYRNEATIRLIKGRVRLQDIDHWAMWQLRRPINKRLSRGMVSGFLKIHPQRNLPKYFTGQKTWGFGG